MTATNNLAKTILLSMLLIAASGCSGFLKPHKMPIQQGNIITQEMLDKLEIGMTPNQVKYVLGTPLVVDTFDANKWYYLYRVRLGNGQKLSQRLEVIFSDGALASYDSDYEFDLPDGETITRTIPGGAKPKPGE